MTRPLVVVPAARQHGVTAVAVALADAVQAIDGVAGVSLEDAPAGTPLHVQFTDRLWGASPDAAATAFERAAARHPLSVTLHDVPQPSDGERNLPRRAAAYARVVRAARGTAVSSRYEAALVGRHTTDAEIEAIPLPVDADAADAPGEATGRDVAVLGFFYPGKGHDEALVAAVAAGASGVSVLGRASDGHEADLDAFVGRATAAGMPVEVTGYLSDTDLRARARAAGVPVLAHRHVSASASLGTWIAAGRRPLVARNAYTEEYAALRPGTITLVDDLDDAVIAALADPRSTWRAEGSAGAWTSAEAARAYLAWWAGIPWEAGRP